MRDRPRHRLALLSGGLCLALLAACGVNVSRLVVLHGRPTTTTALLEAAGPLRLTVTPSAGPAGTSFHLHLTGLLANDVVTFSIAAQGGHPYTGPTHSPAPDGTVSAVYETLPTDTLGLYVVLAHTAAGRGAFATFRVGPPGAQPPPPTG
jgi:hypothetical protein